MLILFLFIYNLLIAEQPECSFPKQTDFQNLTINPDVWSMAGNAFCVAKDKGFVSKETYTIIDYSINSSEKRLWVLDLHKHTVIFHEYVAHGRGSDSGQGTDVEHDGMMSTVSNENGSNQTSVGVYKTAETYVGKHGFSLNLDGLEKGFNDRARSRRIVVHGASYVSKKYIKNNGQLGRSHGCPSVDQNISKELISTIQDGTLIFAYFPDDSWLNNSKFLK